MEGSGFTAASDPSETAWVGCIAIVGEIFTNAPGVGWAGGADDATGAVFFLDLVAGTVVLAEVSGNALVAVSEGLVGIILGDDGGAGDAENAAK